MNETQARIKHGVDLADTMTDDQHKTVEEACERVRMGVSGYWHELAELVVENSRHREALSQIFEWWDKRDGHLVTHYPDNVTRQMESFRPIKQ